MPAPDDDAPAEPTCPTGSSWTVGSVRVTPLYDATLFTPPDLIYRLADRHFPVVPGSLGRSAADWQLHDRVLTDGLLELTFGAFVVDDGNGRLVLVDAGQGPTDAAPEPELSPQAYGFLLSSMSAAGLQPEDITDVVFTHLHADHVGWASLDDRPTFPNATYRCHADDLCEFVPASPVVTRALAPALDRMVSWDGPGSIVGPVVARPAPGHTPGTTILSVESDGDRLWLLGDVYHSAPELTDAIGWSGMGDRDAVGALRTRLRVADILEHEEIPFAGAHFPGLPLQRLVRLDGSRTLVPA